MSRLPCTWLLLRPSASPISSSYDPTLLWIPTPLFASSRYNKHWNPPLPYFTLFSALSLHLHPWASPLSPNILPGMEGAEHSTCLDPSRHHRPVDLSWKGWVVEEHGWVWMEGWGGYSCRLKVKVGGWGISALMEKTQRKQEATPLTHPEACGVTQLTLGQPRVFSFLPWCSCAVLVYPARVLRRFNVAIGYWKHETMATRSKKKLCWNMPVQHDDSLLSLWFDLPGPIRSLGDSPQRASGRRVQQYEWLCTLCGSHHPAQAVQEVCSQKQCFHRRLPRL